MGFTLKKLLSTFLMPLSIGLILFILGLWFLYTNSYKKAKIYLGISFLWIFLISYSPFANSLLAPLEDQYQEIQSPLDAKYILLLGGDFKSRAYEAIKLHHLIHDSIIITSGYPGSYKTTPEAVVNANKLIQLGIPKENILMQTKPRDTAEEAQQIKKIVKDEPFIVVTAAYHMPRAMGLFKKEGLNAIAAPTNFLSSNSSLLSVPNGRTLHKTEIALHEYLGMLWYKLKALF